jgi:hypothetical protein
VNERDSKADVCRTLTLREQKNSQRRHRENLDGARFVVRRQSTATYIRIAASRRRRRRKRVHLPNAANNKIGRRANLARFVHLRSANTISAPAMPLQTFPRLKERIQTTTFHLSLIRVDTFAV